MIGRTKDRIRRLEALDVHPEQSKQLLPAWLRSELEGQGWSFDSHGVIFVPKNDTDSILGGTSQRLCQSTEQESNAMRRFFIDRGPSQHASGPNKPTQ
jgi:hypothetical protein